jgi:hypothetical protein
MKRLLSVIFVCLSLNSASAFAGSIWCVTPMYKSFSVTYTGRAYCESFDGTMFLSEASAKAEAARREGNITGWCADKDDIKRLKKRYCANNKYFTSVSRIKADSEHQRLRSEEQKRIAEDERKKEETRKSKREWQYPRSEDDPFSTRVKGYGDFTFGMSLDEAQTIDPRVEVYVNEFLHLSTDELSNLPEDEDRECDFVSVKSCGIFQSSIMGEEVKVTLQAKDGEHINQILLTFHRWDSPGGSKACAKSAQTIVKNLIRVYGLPTRYKKIPYQLRYESVTGGSIGFTSFCLGADSGMFLASYEPTLGL